MFQFFQPFSLKLQGLRRGDLWKLCSVVTQVKRRLLLTLTWCPRGQCLPPGLSSSLRRAEAGEGPCLGVRGLPSGARHRTFSRDAGGGAGDSWAGRASRAAQGQGSLCSRPGEPALRLEPLVTDSLEEGALPWMQKPGWFPRSSPHEQRHRHGGAANSLEKAGGLEGRGEPEKLGWAIQAHLPALNAKLKALHGVVNC